MLVGGHARAFALDPDQAEISARGAVVDILAIEHDHMAACPQEPEGKRGSDHAGSDYDDFSVLQGMLVPSASCHLTAA